MSTQLNQAPAMPFGDVVEAHTGNGKTIPFRPLVAASGNHYFGVTQTLKNGSRKFASRGVNLPISLVGEPSEIGEIRFPALGLTVKVKVDKTEKGHARATAEHQFTDDHGTVWVVDFRASRIDNHPDEINVRGSLRRKSGGGGLRVQEDW